MVSRGLTERVDLHGRASLVVIAHEAVETAVRPGRPLHPPACVVRVAVPSAVAVLPPRHPTLGVVGEEQRSAGGVDDAHQSGCEVVLVPDELRALLAGRAAQAETGDHAVLAGDVEVVTAGVADRGEDALAVVVELDPVAVAVADRVQRQCPGQLSVRKRREVQCPARLRIADGVSAVLRSGQSEARALGRQHGPAGRRMRVSQQHRAGCGEAHAVGVDFQPLVEHRTPGRPEPSAGPVRGSVRAAQGERQDTGQLEVRLLQDHLAGGHVHRIPADEPALHRPGEVAWMLVDGDPDPVWDRGGHVAADTQARPDQPAALPPGGHPGEVRRTPAETAQVEHSSATGYQPHAVEQHVADAGLTPAEPRQRVAEDHRSRDQGGGHQGEADRSGHEQRDDAGRERHVLAQGDEVVPRRERRGHGVPGLLVPGLVLDAAAVQHLSDGRLAAGLRIAAQLRRVVGEPAGDVPVGGGISRTPRRRAYLGSDPLVQSGSGRVEDGLVQSET